MLEDFFSTTSFKSSQVFGKEVIESICDDRPKQIEMYANYNRGGKNVQAEEFYKISQFVLCVPSLRINS